MLPQSTTNATKKQEPKVLMRFIKTPTNLPTSTPTTPTTSNGTVGLQLSSQQQLNVEASSTSSSGSSSSINTSAPLNVVASTTSAFTSTSRSIASSKDVKFKSQKQPATSDHENKRFSQVILMCTKCQATLAVNTPEKRMFNVYQEGNYHVVLSDQSVIGGALTETETGEDQKQTKDKRFKKTHLLFCTQCNTKVGCRVPGNFPKTYIPRRMFDGECCQVKCTDREDGQQVVMNVKEWRGLRYSLEDYGLYTTGRQNYSSRRNDRNGSLNAPISNNYRKMPIERPNFSERNNGPNNQQFSHNRTRNQQVVVEQQKVENILTKPMKSNEILDYLGNDIGDTNPFAPKSVRKGNHNFHQEPKPHMFPKKEKKVYTMRNEIDLRRYIDNCLLKEGLEQYFIINFTKDEFKDIFGIDGVLQKSVDFKLIEKILKVFSHKEIELSTNKSLITTMFSLLMNSSFWTKDVKRYISKDVYEDEQVSDLLSVFQKCLEFCPLEAERVYIDNLEEIYKPQTHRETISILKARRKQVLKSNMSSTVEKKASDEDAEEIEEVIEDISVFPTLNELITKTKFTMKNIVDGQYPSLKQYLKTQIMLLREDFIHPLKEGITSFITGNFNQRSISVFTDVQFNSVMRSENELVHSLSFKYPWKNINWKCSKKLAFGSLLCLFPQQGSGKDATLTQACEPIFVTVIDRKDVEKGFIHVSVSRVEDFKFISLTGKYIMFESPTYFPSVKPVIDSLKHMLNETLTDVTKFPFYDEFVKVKTQKPPLYIEKNSFMSMDVIQGKTRKLSTSSNSIKAPINVLSDWIDDSETFLDPSQNKAVEHVIRNRVSICIGPPGTGKTFTGIEVAKLLKSHPEMRDRQLVCITYTNHALDQFLEGLIDYFPEIVRIGSRSKSQNQKLLDRNIGELRFRTLPSYLYHEKKDIGQKLTVLSNAVGTIELAIKNPDGAIFGFLSKSLVFARALIQFPVFLYTKRNPAPKTHREMFNRWLEGDDLRRRQYLNKNKKLKNSNQNRNAFEVLEEGYQHEQEESEEQLEIIEEVPPTQLIKIEPINETVELPQDAEDVIEEQIEAELINEEMDNRFGYEEHLLTEEQAVTSMFDYSDLGVETLSDGLESIEQIVKQYGGDIYRIPLEKRKSMLKPIREYNEKLLKTRLIDLTKMRSEYEQRKREIQLEGDYMILRKASVIGLTSTAASMNRNLLNRLRAPIYLIEEAAELLEGQITSVLHPNVEHLIMIGDEKQLQPKVNSYYLEQHCDITVSLFERLIRNNLEYVSLNIQQRMRPEIRELVDMFYDRLTDHESVTKYESVNGVGTNVCFIDHKKPESKSEDVQSFTNPHEAEFLSKFCKYLINVRQYKAKHITILTPYRGQVILIKKTLKKLVDDHYYTNIRVSTIDDYQGEENEIILLSLVRSNTDDQLGFVKIANRIIVSLSRAKKGLYIIGNYSLLRNNEDWRKVFARLNNSNRILDHLPLSCPKHTDEKTCIKEPHDFDGVIWGGCTKPCTHRYPCGHLCPLSCHHDSLHKGRKCEKVCDELHEDCKHRCKEKCHHGRSCPKCTTEVDYAFNDCGHSNKIPCHSKNSVQICKEKCGKPLLGCGHSCLGQCGRCKITHCGPCQATVKDSCEKCNKTYTRACSNPRKCTNQCTFKLPCGHNCSGKCGDCSLDGNHKACGFNCERSLICGHICKGNHTCSTPCPKCEKTCVFKCFHGIGCEKKCHEMCCECKEKCPIQCPHRTCTNLCHEICNVDPCYEKCPKKCNVCSHACLGMCGEPCPPCMHCDALNKSEGEMWQCPISLMTYEELVKDNNERVYYLPECGHIIQLEMMDNAVSTFFETSDQGISIKYLSCPCCRTPIFTAPRYQKGIKEGVKRMEKLKYIIYKKKEEEELKQRKEAIRLVSAEAGYAAGHWFACPNGHPYFIGECGGAMQESVCVDCGARVGGTSHTLLADNSLATNVDGATVPRWPTMLNR